jgi:acetoacetyl-CoA reductase
MTHRALVTGGSAGIGAEIAMRLLARGIEVHIADIADEQLRTMTASTGVIGHRVDVSNFTEVESICAAIADKYGPIDILVNNAGITRDAMIHKMPPEHWHQVIQVNLTSVFNTVRCLAPSLRELGWGRIINMSSMNGLRGQFGQANYAAAKAGMIGFTKSIALELAGKGVTANCVAPGFILTDMTRAMKPEILEAESAKIPANRLGDVGDIAAAVAFLASDDASYITGQVLSVNGGQFM